MGQMTRTVYFIAQVRGLDQTFSNLLRTLLEDILAKNWVLNPWGKKSMRVRSFGHFYKVK